MKKVSITDIAKHASVSRSTVSQFLNKRYNYMGKDTKKRIEQSIQALDYKPNQIARSLKLKKTSTIGVIVANILHAFSTQVIQSIEKYCHTNEFHVIVCNSDDNPKTERNHIEMLRAKQVDGLIVFPTGGNFDLYERIVKESYPLVFMDRLSVDNNIPSILLDNEMAVRLGIQHLIGEGITDIGIVTTTLRQHLTPRLERVEGYKKVLKENGIPIKKEWIINAELKQLKNHIDELLNSTDRPQAIIAGNDLTLIETLEYCRSSNRKIPEDIVIVGIDEVPFAKAFDPPLTTIAQPTFDMGEKAATILLGLIEDKNPKVKTVYRFQPQLNIRHSSQFIKKS